MKLKQTKLIQKREIKKIGKYVITLELDDNDIERLEKIKHCEIDKKEIDYFINDIWKIFLTLWKKYDDEKILIQKLWRRRRNIKPGDLIDWEIAKKMLSKEIKKKK